MRPFLQNALAFCKNFPGRIHPEREKRVSGSVSNLLIAGAEKNILLSNKNDGFAQIIIVFCAANLKYMKLLFAQFDHQFFLDQLFIILL